MSDAAETQVVYSLGGAQRLRLEFIELAVERAAVDAENFGGAHTIVAGLFQDAQDVVAGKRKKPLISAQRRKTAEQS